MPDAGGVTPPPPSPIGRARATTPEPLPRVIGAPWPAHPDRTAQGRRAIAEEMRQFTNNRFRPLGGEGRPATHTWCFDCGINGHDWAPTPGLSSSIIPDLIGCYHHLASEAAARTAREHQQQNSGYAAMFAAMNAPGRPQRWHDNGSGMAMPAYFVWVNVSLGSVGQRHVVGLLITAGVHPHDGKQHLHFMILEPRGSDKDDYPYARPLYNGPRFSLFLATMIQAALADTHEAARNGPGGAVLSPDSDIQTWETAATSGVGWAYSRLLRHNAARRAQGLTARDGLCSDYTNLMLRAVAFASHHGITVCPPGHNTRFLDSIHAAEPEAIYRLLGWRLHEWDQALETQARHALR